MELQNAWPNLERRGVALFAISYDTVDTLASFAEKRGITFPLLSDDGSRVIRALGLLNEHLDEQHAVYGITTRDEQRGVAYPGTFVLDKHGVATEKHFEQSYRLRPTAQLFAEYALGTAAEIPVDTVLSSGGGLAVRTWTDVPTYRPYQQIRLHVQLEMPAGLHVYGTPAPDGYQPLQLEVRPLEGLTVGQIDMPVPHPFHIEGLDEHFLVYEGTVLMTLPMLFTSNLGLTSVELELAYQTCTETTCFPPTVVRLEVPLTGLDLIRD